LSNETLTRIAAVEQEAADIIEAARQKRAAAIGAARAEASRRLTAAQGDGAAAGKATVTEIVRHAEAEAEQMRTAAEADHQTTLASARQRLNEAAALIVERTVSADGRP
jgi:vacuolar-type H+-ATPase subunit H